MSIEAMKLALEALDGLSEPYDVLKAQDALRQSIEQAEQAQPVADRENSIIQFALHQFMSNAYSHMNAAAQDKDGRRYPPEAVEKFAKDAQDAEALLSRLQFITPPPRQPLTDEEIDNATRKQVDALLDHIYEFGTAAEGIDFRVRAIARAIEAAHGIKENT